MNPGQQLELALEKRSNQEAPMAICPNGHDSASSDFCDLCGTRIASRYDQQVARGKHKATPSVAADGGGDACPRCGTTRVGQFCEACGYKFGTAQPPWAPAPHVPAPPSGTAFSSAPAPAPAPWPPPPAAPRSFRPPPWAPAPPSPQAPPRYAPTGWTAVVSCDRAYHESVRAANSPQAVVSCPAHFAERRFALTGSQMKIGRRSVERGVDPEIDLTGPPADPGISRLHAVLIAMPDGAWAVLDPGSANGTLVNGNAIPTGVQVPLHDGDRINLGGWTAITVHRG
jgi:hypothetical protein